jgi:UDP-glucose 4-epimerase
MMRRFERPLVLGGAGFLGTWLVAQLRAVGLAPTVVDDLSTGRRAQGGSGDLIVGDVRTIDLPSLLAARRIDVVFHLATSAYVPPSVDDPRTDLERNVVTTLAVLEAARRCQPRPLVVLASSAAVYGEAVFLPMREDHPLDPVSPYGVSKLAAEHYLALYARLHSVPGLAIRLFSLYGPGQSKQVVYDLINRALSGELPLTVLGSPEATRDFVFVEDAARAFVRLAEVAPAVGEAYNLATGRPIGIADLASAVVAAVGADIPIVFPGQARPGDPLHWHGDATRARDLGVSVDTPLEQGLRLTVDWVRAERTVNGLGLAP